MGQDSFIPQKRAGAAAGNGAVLPTTASGGMFGRPRVRTRQIAKTFNNIKITILCLFITILVLRGTIGINLLATQPDDAQQSLMEEANRVIAEIRSDGQLPDDEPFMNPNVTFTFGYRISDWDERRRSWLKENPDFPSKVNGRPRMLLVSGSPPNPCDNPIGDHYLLKSIKNKIDYCRIHGIEIVYNMAHLDKDLSGYWAKLPLIRRLMLSHPEIEWIWWMDSDALFTDMVFEIPVKKYEQYNMVIHGYPDLLFEKKSWIALNTGSVLFRNCQWMLDFLDVWAPMGPRGPIRDEAGKILTSYLSGRPAFEADDQSALIYLLISQKEQWMDKVFVENSYYLHGFWTGLVDKYEEMVEKYHPGLGDERWPFVTHFVGCKPCGSYGDYPVEKCLKSMERAFNFADNQVLKLYGFRHRGLLSPKIKRTRNETTTPLDNVNQFDIRHSGHIIGSEPNRHFSLTLLIKFPKPGALAAALAYGLLISLEQNNRRFGGFGDQAAQGQKNEVTDTILLLRLPIQPVTPSNDSGRVVRCKSSSSDSEHPENEDDELAPKDPSFETSRSSCSLCGKTFKTAHSS